MKRYFISFANTQSNFSNERIIFESQQTGLFDESIFYTENDFDADFLKSNGRYFDIYKRGYGYWSWKPYVIKKQLEKLDDGDILMYADAGCSFNLKNKDTLEKWFDTVSKSESGVFSPCFGPYTEYEWTRGDLYNYVNQTYNKKGLNIFDNTLQCGATSIILCKNKKSVDFINQWYDIMTNHFHLCTDEPSSLPNHPKFIENRHDQSALSLLTKIYGINYVESINGGVSDKTNSPIYAARIRNDKKTWKKP